MKFGRRLLRETNPQFRHYYLSYKDLKKAIKVITGNETSTAYSLRDVANNFGNASAFAGSVFRPCQARLQDLLNAEKDKINKFMDVTLAAVNSALRNLLKEIAREEYDVSKEKVFDSFENSCDEQAEQLLFLQSYQELNYTGFRKITKKYDKHNHSNASAWYMAQLQNETFMLADFETPLQFLSVCYQTIREKKRFSDVSLTAAENGRRESTRGQKLEILVEEEKVDSEGSVVGSPANKIDVCENNNTKKTSSSSDTHDEPSAGNKKESSLTLTSTSSMLSPRIDQLPLSSGDKFVSAASIIYSDSKGFDKYETDTNNDGDKTEDKIKTEDKDNEIDEPASEFDFLNNKHSPNSDDEKERPRNVTAKYLVKQNDVMKLKILLLKHVPLKAFGSTPVVVHNVLEHCFNPLANVLHPEVSSIHKLIKTSHGCTYLDNENFDLYKSLLSSKSSSCDPKDESPSADNDRITSSVIRSEPFYRFKWFGENHGELDKEVILEKFDTAERASDAQEWPELVLDNEKGNVHDSVSLKQKNIPKILNNTFEVDEWIQNKKLPDSKKGDVINLLNDTISMIQIKQLRPMVQFWWYRTSFRTVCRNKKGLETQLCINLDEHIRFVSEVDGEGHPIYRNNRHWILPFPAEEELESLPFSLLTVSYDIKDQECSPEQPSYASAEQTMDSVLQMIIRLSSVTEIWGFSFQVHGMAHIARNIRGLDLDLPHWFVFVSCAQHEEVNQDNSRDSKEDNEERNRLIDSGGIILDDSLDSPNSEIQKSKKKKTTNQSQQQQNLIRRPSICSNGSINHFLNVSAPPFPSGCDLNPPSLSSSTYVKRSSGVGVDVLKNSPGLQLHLHGEEDLQLAIDSRHRASKQFDNLPVSYGSANRSLKVNNNNNSFIPDDQKQKKQIKRQQQPLLPPPKFLDGAPPLATSFAGMPSPLVQSMAGRPDDLHHPLLRENRSTSMFTDCCGVRRLCGLMVVAFWTPLRKLSEFIFGVDKNSSEKILKAAVRIEPKTFFANERTLLQWMNISVLLATLSITLLNIGGETAQVGGLIMAPIAIYFIAYAYTVYNKRNRALMNKEAIQYTDKWGPAFLVVTLVCGLSAVVILTLFSKQQQQISSSLIPSLSPSQSQLSPNNNYEPDPDAMNTGNGINPPPISQSLEGQAADLAVKIISTVPMLRGSNS